MPGSPSPGMSRQRSRNASFEMPRRCRVAERLQELLRRVALVAGLERRVRGEDDVLANALERLVERHPRRDVLRDALERSQRRMALVEVQDVRPDVECLEHAGAAEAEQAVLREADVRVAVIGARRRPARHRVVLRQLGVEHSRETLPTWHAPDLERDLAAEDRHPQLQRLAVLAVDERHRQLVRVVVEPVLLLRAGQVEALNEVAAAVEDPDADHLQAAVARLLEHVARKHAEPARVAGQRGVHAELGREVGDGPVVLRSRREAARRRRVELLREPVDALDDVRVGRDRELAVVVQAEEELDRVATREAPAVRVDLGEDEAAAADPAPAQVVRDAGPAASARRRAGARARRSAWRGRCGRWSRRRGRSRPQPNRTRGEKVPVRLDAQPFPCSETCRRAKPGANLAFLVRHNRAAAGGQADARSDRDLAADDQRPRQRRGPPRGHLPGARPGAPPVGDERRRRERRGEARRASSRCSTTSSTSRAR